MIKNYFKVALRNIKRNKLFSGINILGLAVGMACSIFILLWVQHERSYDRFHKNGKDIYRFISGINQLEACLSPAPLAKAMRQTMPEVVNTCVLVNWQGLVQNGDRRFEEKSAFFADSTFFEFFSFKLLKGDKKTALVNPTNIVITESTAKKYFGNEDPMGKVLRLNNNDHFTVSGVMADVPSNSHLQFDLLLPMRYYADRNRDFINNVWDNFNYYTYVQLSGVNSKADLKNTEEKLHALYRQHEKDLELRVWLQPLFDIHLYSNFLGDVGGHGNILYVRVFSIVAVIVLIVACINFMNLATARSARRAKEVGLRKVVGARRLQIIGQFLGESALIAFIALLIAVGLVFLLLPAFNNLAQKEIGLDFTDGSFWLMLVGIAILTGLISGSYPAFFLSSFKPVKVLKGRFNFGDRGIWIRNTLVVGQFVISISLMVSTFVVYNQLQYIRNKNLGFDRENLLYVPITGRLWEVNNTLRSTLQQNPLTQDYTFISGLPTDLVSGTVSIEWPGKDPRSQVIFAQFAVDENFVKTFKTTIVAGRNFSKDIKSDSSNYLLNEKAIKLMGMTPESAIGQPFTMWGIKGTIVGVVKDFHFKPIHQPIEPLVLRYGTNNNFLVVRTQPGNTEATINSLKNICTQLNPDRPFQYDFLDQDLAKLYRSEQQMGNIFNVFTALAIFISCLGLFGLTNFIAEKRTREIGIRKVIGASVSSIVTLLSKGLIGLMFVAVLIAVPLSWWAMNNWLQNFAYHTNISWWIFVIAAFASLLIALITVSFQAIKAALANPIKSLRSE